MKINAVGIDAYRQTVSEAQVNRKSSSADNQAQTTKSDKVQIPGQGDNIGSRLAVQLKKGTFMDMLSEEEKRALEMVFEKFRSLEINGKSYDNNGASKRANLGNIVDVKL